MNQAFLQLAPQSEADKIAEMKSRKLAEEKLSPLVRNSHSVLQFERAKASEKTWKSLTFETITTQEDLAQALNRLAESYFGGNFELAVFYAIDKTTQKEYIKFRNAFKDLGKICKCDFIQVADGITAQGTLIPAKRSIQHIFVEALEAKVDFIMCEKCKILFCKRI